MKKETKNIKGMVDELEIKLEEIFVGKLWALPKKVKEAIVVIAPYLSIISLILIIPMVLALMGLSFFAPVVFLGGVTAGLGYTFSILFGLVGGILAVSVIPGLFKRQIKSWRVLFWVSLINALGELFKMDLGNLIIGTAISWYVLFQVKEYYK